MISRDRVRPNATDNGRALRPGDHGAARFAEENFLKFFSAGRPSSGAADNRLRADHFPEVAPKRLFSSDEMIALNELDFLQACANAYDRTESRTASKSMPA
jgi:hypothetical protein